MFDPAQVIIFNELLSAIAEEMGIRLERSAHSPNIKERRDYSCAVFDSQGRLAAQAAHIPVHLGAMAALVRALIPVIEWEAGDAVICNDPYLAGTHLPDISIVSPVFIGSRLAGFVASRAHHADIGGASPGSMPLVGDVFAEGLRIPPIKLNRHPDVLELLCANSRAPAERRGDIHAQLAANRAGVSGLQQLASRPDFDDRVSQAIAYTAALTEQAIASIPDGAYVFEDRLDSDGLSADPVPIQVTVRVKGARIEFDFTGSAPQRPAGINATLAVTESACLFIVRCLLDADAPTNDGCRTCLTVIAPEGTVVNARFPAPVAGGNVETSQRITDVLLGALAQAIPNRIPAASQGTMNNLTFGGWDSALDRPFAYYETIGGGGGASANGHGTSGVHSHMTNTRNTPIEALEYAMPLRVLECRSASPGGRGRMRGGAGIRKSIQFLVPVSGTLLAERRVFRPFGVAGGEPGRPGRDTVTVYGKTRRLRAKGRFEIPADGILTIQTPSGGGWGRQ